MENYTEATVKFGEGYTIHFITFANVFYGTGIIKQEEKVKEYQGKFFEEHPEEDKNNHIFFGLTPKGHLPFVVEKDGSISYHLSDFLATTGVEESSREDYNKIIKERMGGNIDESVFRVI